ncbi:rCG39617 [Rattus norvegicus]|uniref:RCG39617 n=1 Tax=Rattus norvegicus TaxID=10116 RepID=A6I910_RAT|nr:rCG39617 [Rattus norvegicus]
MRLKRAGEMMRSLRAGQVTEMGLQSAGDGIQALVHSKKIFSGELFPGLPGMPSSLFLKILCPFYRGGR